MMLLRKGNNDVIFIDIMAMMPVITMSRALTTSKLRGGGLSW